MQLDLPQNFVEQICNAYGEQGRNWLDQLPFIVKQCEELWEISCISSHYQLSYNFITDAKRIDGTTAVLKMGFPKEKEVITEMNALEEFGGNHIVKIHHSSHGIGAMLLEKVSPGIVLTEVQEKDDVEATEIAARLMRDILADTQLSFPHVKDWAKALNNAHGISRDMIEKAKRLVVDLDASKQEEKLLHGDLHHDNILYDEQCGWIAIDPKGVIGDPAFNAARFLSNPIHYDFAQSSMEKRIDILSSSLEISKHRILGWAYVDCIIRACWMLEDADHLEVDLTCARVLDSLLTKC